MESAEQIKKLFWDRCFKSGLGQPDFDLMVEYSIERENQARVESVADTQAEADSKIIALEVERDHYRVSVNSLQKELSDLRKQLDVYGNPKYRISVFELNRELTDLRGRVERAKEHFEYELSRIKEISQAGKAYIKGIAILSCNEVPRADNHQPSGK